ncbi:hypothetical protein [Mycolicibacterium nivoides]|uniref:hypothetical protein n=1 Tax=Mycolicibacterium nivoides TaxID=2487344 RepID=UPI000F5B9D8E|nr:hypothetical protein [Mycolicibacterium nivoides]
MLSASDKQFFYHACQSDMTPSAMKRSLESVQFVADDAGVDISNENVELWVKPGHYLVGVSVNFDDADARSHRAQMEADGWSRRA